MLEGLSRGADGAMTGFSFPEMLVELIRLLASGIIEDAKDIFDAYTPLVRYEQQPGYGLAVRIFFKGAVQLPTQRPVLQGRI